MGTVGLKSCPVSLLFLDITVVQVPVVMSGFPRRCAAKVSPMSSQFRGPQLACTCLRVGFADLRVKYAR